MHLQGRAGLSLREAVLRGRRPLSEPDIKIIGKARARVWAPASCPAPVPEGLELLAPQPASIPPIPIPLTDGIPQPPTTHKSPHLNTIFS